jgi:hypothetical protein
MPIKLLIVLLLLISPCVSGSAEHDDLAYIVAPADGAVISGQVTVIFGLRNPYGVAPAGVVKDNTGHHHLLIDTDLPDLNSPIPNDENHRHFGGGQTETVLRLPPGKHTLQLLLGDFAHIAHKPPVMSERITITVE